MAQSLPETIGLEAVPLRRKRRRESWQQQHMTVPELEHVHVSGQPPKRQPPSRSIATVESSCRGRTPDQDIAVPDSFVQGIAIKETAPTRNGELRQDDKLSQHEPAHQHGLPKPEASGNVDAESSISHWARTGHWSRTYLEDNTMAHMFKKKALQTRPDRKRSDSERSSVNQSDASSHIPTTTTRENKSAPYRTKGYLFLLNARGSFMCDSEQGMTDVSKELCQQLLEHHQPVPENSLFRADVFIATCYMASQKNEASVLRDITPLIAPSAELLALYGAVELKGLTESINEGWDNAIPMFGTRPQPDFSVGFKREAFTEAQLVKIDKFLGAWYAGDQCFFLGTCYMLFPFFTCEVKCGSGALEVADRQNQHSMTLAVRAIVELFRFVGRESEVHRQILAFAISHNDDSVRIYGYYAIVAGRATKYHRYLIDSISLLAGGGRDRRKAYQFTTNVYKIWMPKHLERILSALAGVPADLDFDLHVTAAPSAPSTLSQAWHSPAPSSATVPQANDPTHPTPPRPRALSWRQVPPRDRSQLDISCTPVRTGGSGLRSWLRSKTESAQYVYCLCLNLFYIRYLGWLCCSCCKRFATP